MSGPEENLTTCEGGRKVSGPLGYMAGVDMKAVGWPTRVKPEIESLALPTGTPWATVPYPQSYFLHNEHHHTDSVSSPPRPRL